MQLIRGAHNLATGGRPCVATIGNFDGVHLGHQWVLRRLKEQGARHGLPTVVVLFEPQSAEYFATAEVPPRLTRLREKYCLLRDFGVDRLLVLRFDARLAAWSAAEFIDRILVGGLGVRSLIVGHDFKFGSRREGDFDTLCNAGACHGFEVLQTEPYLIGGQRVSSSRVRALLLAGRMESAAELLGHRYFMSGRVVHGAKRGRAIGFPTANIDLHRMRAPLNGIYASFVHGLGAQPLPSVAYVGSRPIVADPRFVLEVHVFDYAADCYGRHITVDFVSHVRDDMNFESFEALGRQIARDCEVARTMLAANGCASPA